MIEGLSLHPGFVSRPEAESLRRDLETTGVWRQDSGRLSKRWYDLRYCDLKPHRFGVSSAENPPFIDFLVERIMIRGLAGEPPYRLIYTNYSPGAGFHAHMDSVNLPWQRDRHMILSFLSLREMRFYPNRSREKASLEGIVSEVMPPRSLLVMSGYVRYHMQHELQPGPELRSSLVLSFREK